MGARDGLRNVTVEARDGATPVNTARGSFSFVRDTEEPTFTLSKTQSDINAQSATAVTVSIGGTISDANVIRSAELQLRRVGTGQTCATADTLPRREGTNRRVSRNRVDLENDTNSITFDETFAISAPEGVGTGPENLCFYLESEDIAVMPNGRDDGNPGNYVLNEFMVTWPAGPPPGPTFEFSSIVAPATASAAVTGLDVAEGTSATTYWVKLSDEADPPTAAAPVNVSISAEAGVSASPSTFNFWDAGATAALDSVEVTITTAHDLDIDSEELALTHSASGFDDATLTVTSNDDDFEIDVDVTSVDEDDGPVDVLVTVTAGMEAPTNGTVVEVSFAGAGDNDGADDFVAINPITLTIPAGMTTDTATVEVDAIDDAFMMEAGETIRLTGPNSDPLVGAAYVEPENITIVDDDPDIQLSVNMAEVVEVAEDAGATELTVTASVPEDVGQIVQITVTLPEDTETPARWTFSQPTLTLNLSGATSVTGTVTLTPADNHDSDITIDITGVSAQQKTGVTPAVVYTVGGAKVKITNQDDS